MSETLLSFDPGAVHCGVALWVCLPDPLVNGIRWKCRDAWEAPTPEEFVDSVKSMLEAGTVDRVAGEAFFLQQKKALQQIGSSFGTVEVIGAVRHLCRWHEIPFTLIPADARAVAYKKMRAVGYRFPRASDHVKSAVSVGACATGWLAINHFQGDGVGDIPKSRLKRGRND